MAEGTKVGSAYVEVTPKASANFKSAIEKSVPSGEKGGGKFGKEFSSGMKASIGAGAVAVGNILADVAKQGVSMAKDFVGEALSSFSNYEQLVGGVETLFKDSGAAVAQNAAKAFQTAGMSANDYMEQVTSFSASLIQSLGGDTDAAAAQSDKAIRDMSDNANKMGTDMRSITDAYQGFAKQNYTMLDNLKLGYGGTKTEMERLLADASKIAGVDFNIDSYSDVIEAIHVMQTQMDISGYSVDELRQKLSDMSLTSDELAKVAESMGITTEEAMARMQAGALDYRDAQALLGTTAREAATTVEGSMKQASAAWDNWVAGLGRDDADMSLLTDQLVSSIEIAADNVVPALGRIGQSLASGIPELGARLGPLVMQQVDAVVLPAIAYLSEHGPEMAAGAGEMFAGLAQGVGLALPGALSALGSLVASLIAMVPAALPGMVSGAVSLIMGLLVGLVQYFPTVAAAFGGLILQLPSILMNAAGQMVGAALVFFLSIGEAFGQFVADLGPKFEYFITHLPEIVMGAISGMANAAGQLWDSFIGGLVGACQNGTPMVEGSAEQTAQAAAGAAEAAADASTAGQLLTDTFAQGMDYESVKAAATEAATQGVDTAAQSADGSAIGEAVSATAADSIDLATLEGASVDMVTSAVDAASSVDASQVGRTFSEQAASGVDTGALVGPASEMASATAGAMDGLGASAAAAAQSFAAFATLMTTSMEQGARSAGSAASRIRSALDSLPYSRTVYVNVAQGHVRLPHFSMWGNFNPETKEVPHVSVSWWAKGGIFTQPAVIGVGEGREPEGVFPLSKLDAMMDGSGGKVRDVNVYLDYSAGEDAGKLARDVARRLETILNTEA